MRWSYLLPRAVLALLLWSFLSFGLDPLLRRSVRTSGSLLLHTAVELDALETGTFPPSASLTNLRIADRDDPLRNAVECRALSARIDGAALLRREWIVEEARVEGVAWNTPRSAPAERIELPDLPFAAPRIDARGAFEALGRSATDAGRRWFDELSALSREQLDPESLETVRTARGIHDDWETRFGDLERRAQALEEGLERTRGRARDAAGSTVERIATYRQVALDADRLLREAQALQLEMQQWPEIARGDLERLDQAAQRDVASVHERLGAFAVKAREIDRYLLGEEFARRTAEATEWLERVRSVAAQFSSEDPEFARARGIDVPFGPRRTGPRVLIRALHLDGAGRIGGEDLAVRVGLRDVASEPERHDRPLAFRVQGRGRSELELVGTWDRRTAPDQVTCDVQWTTPDERQFVLGEADRFGLSVRAGRTQVTAHLATHGRALSGRWEWRQSPVEIAWLGETLPRGAGDSSAGIVPASAVARTASTVRTLSNPAGATTASAADPASDTGSLPDAWRSVVARALAGIDHVSAQIELSGTLDEPQWTLSSNLGDVLQHALGETVRQELAAREKVWTDQARAEIDRQGQSLRRDLGSRHARLASRLTQGESLSKQLVASLARGPLDRLGLPGPSLPGGLTLPNGVALPNGAALPGGLALPKGVELPRRVEMPKGVALPKGLAVPSGLGLPSGGVRPANGTSAGEPSRSSAVPATSVPSAATAPATGPAPNPVRPPQGAIVPTAGTLLRRLSER